MLTIRERIRTKACAFLYNFGWSKYVELLDGRVSHLSYSVPIVGYMVLFNDSITKKLTYFNLISGGGATFISGGTRIKLLYLALVFIGISNIIYRHKRPNVLLKCRDLYSYVDMGLRNFTIHTYVQLHDEIKYAKFGHCTRHGEYSDTDWDAFLARALGANSRSGVSAQDPRAGHWVEAKSEFEGLLRDILTETFFRESTKTRRVWLISCVALAKIGYAFLVILSMDLIISVIVQMLCS